MKKMKKVLAVLAGSTMLSLSLAGCSQSAPQTGGTKTGTEAADAGKAASGGKEKIRVFTFFTGSDQWAPVWSEVIAEYMAANPNIEIVDESAPTAGVNDVFRTKMQADIAAGTPADLSIFYTGADGKPLVDSGLFVDFGTYMKDDEKWSGNFKQSALDSQKYDGVQYSLPYLGYYEGLFYNKELFEKYGLEEPVSYDNIMKAIKVFAENDIPAFASSMAKPSYLLELSILAQSGGEGHKNYFDDSWAPALDSIAEWYQMGAFPKDTMTISEDDIRLMFKEGKAAMMINGSWCVSALEDNENMRLIAMPAFPGGKGGEDCVIAGFGSGWFFSKKAAERSDETLKLLKYLTSPEIVQRFIAVGGSSAIECPVPEGASLLKKSAVEMLNKASYTDTAIDSQVSREAWMAIADDGAPYLVEGKRTSLELLAEARKILEATSK